MIKFSCTPKGDQPMQIEWFKETNPLVPNSQSNSQQSKYSEIITLYTNSSDLQVPRQKHQSLVVQSSSGSAGFTFVSPEVSGVRSSELVINYADRMDTGNFVCLARNGYGKDELTYRLIVQEVPDAPVALNTQNIQTTSLKLVWSLPFDGNSPVSHFIIEYRRQQPDSPVPDTSHQHREWTRLVVGSNKLATGQETSIMNITANGVLSQSSNSAGGSSLSLLVRQLSARTTYHFRVAAMNGVGQSGFSMPISVTTAEEPPGGRPNDLRAQPISSSSIKAIWRAPSPVEESAPIRGYYIKHRRLAIDSSLQPQAGVEQQGSQNHWIATASISANNMSNFNGISMDSRSPVQTASSSGSAMEQLASSGTYEFVVNGLEKNTKYEIRVQPFNSIGVGPASDTIGQTLKFDKPAQPHLKLVAAKRQSFELRWTISDQQPLMGFSLFYKLEYDDWQEIQLAIVYQHVIEGLRCGNKYQIYLSAFNMVGRSDPSDVLTARTEGTAPLAPDKSRFIQSNITQVLLDMTAWKSGGCPINSFMIQYKRLHDSSLFGVSEGSTPFTNLDRVSIPDLQPATWYKLLVTAINEAGSTNAEYLFNTLTLSGEQVMPPFPIDRESSHISSASHSVLGNLNRLLWASNHHSNSSESQGSDVLLPTACLILLLVSSVVIYIYYSRAAAKTRRRNSSPGSNSIISVPSSRVTENLDHSGSKSKGLTQPVSFCTSTACSDEQHELYSAAQPSCYTNGQLYGQAERSNGLPHQHYSGLDWPMTSNDSAIDSMLSSRSPATTAPTISNSGGQRSFSGFSQFGTLNPMKVNSNAMHTRTLQLKSNRSDHTNSSSASTQSTCCFDGSSSQASSGASGGAKTKLQLINENSAPVVNDQPVPYVYANTELPATTSNEINGATRQDPSTQHVNLLTDQQTFVDFGQFAAPNLATLFGEQSNEQVGFYASQPSRLVSSASFVSGDELLRHQGHFCIHPQHQPDSGEPIYQRLDKMHQFCPSNASKHHQLANQQTNIRSQTLRFNSHPSDESSKTSMTLHRGQVPSLLATSFYQQPEATTTNPIGPNGFILQNSNQIN